MITHLWIDIRLGKLTAVKPDISGKEVKVISLSVQTDISVIADELTMLTRHLGKDIVYDVQIQIPEY